MKKKRYFLVFYNYLTKDKYGDIIAEGSGNLSIKVNGHTYLNKDLTVKNIDEKLKKTHGDSNNYSIAFSNIIELSFADYYYYLKNEEV